MACKKAAADLTSLSPLWRLSKLQRKRSTFATRQQSAFSQTAVHALQRYNTLHFQTESRVPTGRSRPYWMTQRKAGRAAFGSMPCGESRFFCRSTHPDVRLIPAGGLVRHSHHHQPFFHGWADVEFPQVLFGLKSKSRHGNIVF